MTRHMFGMTVEEVFGSVCSQCLNDNRNAMLFHKVRNIFLTAYKIEFFLRDLQEIYIVINLICHFFAGCLVLPEGIAVVYVKAYQSAVVMGSLHGIEVRTSGGFFCHIYGSCMNHSGLADLVFINIILCKKHICPRFSGKCKGSLSILI